MSASRPARWTLLILLIALLAAGWLLRDRFAPVEVGSVAPDFVATDLLGNSVRLDDLHGEVVLLNIWATWCGPCRDEMPSMQRLHERLAPRGLRLVAVSVDHQIDIGGPSGTSRSIVRRFVDELELTFPIWLDPSRRIQQTYRTTAVPESFLIGRDGVIMKKVIGPTEWDAEELVELIERLLAQHEPGA